jgi:agmatinase
MPLMKGIFINQYIGSKIDEEQTGIVLLGCPLEATSSFRGGTKFAPDSIRKASWTLETYSPYLKQDLDAVMFCDSGNLELRQGDLEYSLDLIEQAATELMGKNKKLLVLGGEHLVTYPVMRAMGRHHRGVQMVHFDAHCDLRNDYEGQRLSHATVMKRVKELGGLEIFQIGVRSGTQREFEELLPIESPASLAARLDRSKPTYVTFDMDVFDPSLAAGVTTPEPGGLTFNEVMAYFSVLRKMELVGADIVELTPDYDTTFVSSIVAAKVAREMLMLMHR